ARAFSSGCANPRQRTRVVSRQARRRGPRGRGHGSKRSRTGQRFHVASAGARGPFSQGRPNGNMSTRVLLIEDEVGLVIALGDRLKSEGYQVETALDGQTGLARALSEPFDLIILDVMLPHKNGFDLCRDLRQQGINAPLLMLTARGQVIDRVIGLKLGADDYLVKP